MIETIKDEHHAIIEPVKSEKNRPLWSVVIPTYNCANYLKETLLSVLLQDPGPEKMEIIVVDDYSTKDNPKEIVDKFGKGRVQFIRQKQNVGKAQNYASGINIANGFLIHLLHGDDLVLDNFYSKVESLFDKHEEIGAAFCRSYYINNKGEVIGKTSCEMQMPGVLTGWLKKIAISQAIATPSIVIKREVYEKLGGYDNRLTNTEDWEMYVRIATFYKVGFIPDILASYRMHAANSSNQMLNNTKWIKIRDLSMSIIDSYLPKDLNEQIIPLRKKAQAQFYLNHIPIIVANRQIRAYFIIITEVLKYAVSLKIIYRIIYFSMYYKKFIKV